MWIFIEHRSHLYSENNPEQSWRYRESYSDTNDSSEQQQRSHYQPAPFNEPQQYFHDRNEKNASSFNAYEMKKWILKVAFIVQYQPPQENVSVIIFGSWKAILKTHLFLLKVILWNKTARYISNSYIPRHNWKRRIQFLHINKFHLGFQLNLIIPLKVRFRSWLSLSLRT